jgi:hypothetical protein
MQVGKNVESFTGTVAVERGFMVIPHRLLGWQYDAVGHGIIWFRIFSPDFSKTKYILFAVIGILAGLSLAWFRLHYGNAKLIDYEKYIIGHALPPNQFFPIERLLMATGYAGLIMLYYG